MTRCSSIVFFRALQEYATRFSVFMRNEEKRKLLLFPQNGPEKNPKMAEFSTFSKINRKYYFKKTLISAFFPEYEFEIEILVFIFKIR